MGLSWPREDDKKHSFSVEENSDDEYVYFEIYLCYQDICISKMTGNFWDITMAYVYCGNNSTFISSFELASIEVHFWNYHRSRLWFSRGPGILDFKYRDVFCSI